jgi:26S proteasome regulatory subunit N3
VYFNQRVVGAYAETFTRDKTISLIARLRHNVIKTGLRKINLSYSRISFADICSKLRLDSPADAEFIVAKAIRDGVIDAVIDHAGGFVQSKQQTDTYATAEVLFAAMYCFDAMASPLFVL